MNEQQQTMQAVYDMRQAQDDYFKQKNDYRLRLAKQKEAAVDRILDNYIKAGIVKPKQKTTDSQQSLFQ